MVTSLIGALVASAAAAAPAAAQTVLTFDDISGCSGQNQVPVGTYDGVNFQNQFTCYAFGQDPYNPESSPNRVYPSVGVQNNTNGGTFTFSPTTFSGAYFSGEQGTSVFFTLFNSGVLVATSGPLTVSSTPAFLSSGYNGAVDQVTVNGSSMGYVMDNVTFGGQMSTTPEPSSVALLGTGLVGLVPMARRRRK